MYTMLNRLLPKQIDNNYRGSWLALWIYTPVVLMKLVMGFNVAGLNPWVSNLGILKDVDGVPLDSYGADAGAMVLLSFASWGLGLFILSLLGVLVLARYRSMIPLMFVLLTMEQIGRKGLSMLYPIARVGGDHLSTGAIVNWVLSAAVLVGLVLSLQTRSAQTHASTPG